MKTYKQFIAHLWNQDDGTNLVERFEKHVAYLRRELESNNQVMVAGDLYTNNDWIDEFFSEATTASVVYRHLARLASNQPDVLPEGTVGKVLDDFFDHWLCELAAVDAQCVDE